MSLQSPMVLPGKRVIRGESLQPFLSCARNCTTPATLSSAQHNSEYLIDLIVRFSTLDFLADWASRGGIMGRPEKIDPTLRRKLGLLRSEVLCSIHQDPTPIAGCSVQSAKERLAPGQRRTRRLTGFQNRSSRSA